ncbi:MAG: adenylate kinase [Candidatus Limnocylindrales bacterium]
MRSEAVAGPAAGKRGSRRIIVMMGAPGAGKGTQAERLSEALGLPHVSTGELFRAMRKSSTPLAQKVREYMDSGALVPDDIVVAMVDDRLTWKDAANGVILDGFPRTVAQAEALDSMLARVGTSVSAVPYIEVPTELLLARLTGRRICTKDDQHVYHVVAMPPKQAGICDIDGAELYQRKDDSEETVQGRLDQQLPPMFEIVDYYAGNDVLFSVPGDQPPEDVTAELLRVINSRTQA